jgi:hypothetical protein
MDRAAEHLRQNLESAQIILTDAKYGGPTAGLVIWARLVSLRASEDKRAGIPLPIARPDLRRIPEQAATFTSDAS